MAEDTSKIPVTTDKALHRRCARGDHWKAFAQKSIVCSMTLALARGAHHSAARFSIWTRFEEPKLHLAVCRQWTSPKLRRATR